MICRYYAIGEVLFCDKILCFKATCSRLTVDLFTFDKDIRPNVVFRSPNEAKLMDDFTKGYEAVPIAVCNEVDYERPPKVVCSFRPLDNFIFCFASH